MNATDRPLIFNLLSLVFRIYATSRLKEWSLDENNGGRSYTFACTFHDRFPVHFSHMREIVSLDKFHIPDVWFEGDTTTTTIAAEVLSHNYPVDMARFTFESENEDDVGHNGVGSKRKKQHT